MFAFLWVKKVAVVGEADNGFVNLKPDHHFQQQDPSLTFAKNNKTLIILTLNLQEWEVLKHPMCLTLPLHGSFNVNNNHDRVTRVNKFQLNYRDCFLQVIVAFRDAEFTLKLGTIGNAWEEATEAFENISITPWMQIYGLLRTSLVCCCQHQKLSSKKHKSNAPAH